MERGPRRGHARQEAGGTDTNTTGRGFPASKQFPEALMGTRRSCGARARPGVHVTAYDKILDANNLTETIQTASASPGAPLPPSSPLSPSQLRLPSFSCLCADTRILFQLEHTPPQPCRPSRALSCAPLVALSATRGASTLCSRPGAETRSETTLLPSPATSRTSTSVGFRSEASSELPRVQRLLMTAGTIGHVDHGKARPLKPPARCGNTNSIDRPPSQPPSPSDRPRRATQSTSTMAPSTRPLRSASVVSPSPQHTSSTPPTTGITPTSTARVTPITSRT